MATYAIGDIHGCWGELERLLAELPFDPAADRLWLVGDLVNKGPGSLAVLRWARRRAEEMGERFVTVLGNHDLHLLAVAAAVPGAKSRHTLDEVLDARDGDELLAWLGRQPLLHRDGSHLLVHAGLLPAWSADDAARHAREVEAALAGAGRRELLASLYRQATERWRDDLPSAERRAQALSALTRLRTLTLDGTVCAEFNGPPAEAPPGCIPWFEHPRRESRPGRDDDVRIVCGHWAALGLRLRPDLAALDSGCVWGNRLTALRLEDDRTWQV